jgi:hypothetical protein
MERHLWVEGIGLGLLMCSDFSIRSCNKSILVGQNTDRWFQTMVYFWTVILFTYSIVLLFS